MSKMDNNIFALVFGSDKAHCSAEFKGFESRTEQIQMASAVESALRKENLLIVEAGTGVGKSLAYLLPLIKWVLGGTKKAVVSTYTKTLQEQLVKKDLPYLKGILDMDFRFALCLGAQNYLCIKRFYQNNRAGLFETHEEKEVLARIRQWAARTETGLRAELDFLPKESLWSGICRESDLCPGRKCLFRRECFYYKARREEYNAHILVTNHHLFFSHVASGGKVLPHFDAVVFDEAHTLEDVATSYLGIEVSNFQWKYFLDSLFNPQTGKGFLFMMKGVSRQSIAQLKKKIGEVRAGVEEFFTQTACIFGENSGSIRIREKPALENCIAEPLTGLISSLKETLNAVDQEDTKIETEVFISRAQRLFLCLDTIIQMQMEDYVYWVEILRRPRGVKYNLSST